LSQRHPPPRKNPLEQPCAPVREAKDVADFLRSPQQACLVGNNFAFYRLQRLCGWSVWGHPSTQQAQELVQCIATAYARGAPPYYSLVDLRWLEAVDAEGFEVLRQFVAGKRQDMKTQLVRQSVVRPAGMVGALAAGFYALIQPLHQVRVFDSVDDAAAWLKPPDPAALSVMVDGLVTHGPMRGAFITALQRWLDDHLTEASPTAAARALGLSARTLQRRLQSHSTTFHAELREARVHRAQQLLLDTDWKLLMVAHHAGCSTSQQLSTLFRHLTGSTPTEYRKKFQRTGRLQAGRKAVE